MVVAKEGSGSVGCRGGHGTVMGKKTVGRLIPAAAPSPVEAPLNDEAGVTVLDAWIVADGTDMVVDMVTGDLVADIVTVLGEVT